MPENNDLKRYSKMEFRLTAVIAVILVIAALKYASSFLIPIAFALFLIALLWPLQKILIQKIPQGLATIISMLVFLAALAVIVGALWLGAEKVSEDLPKYSGELKAYWEQAQEFAQKYGIDLPSVNGENDNSSDQQNQNSGSGSGGKYVLQFLQKVFSFGGAFVLVLAYLGLGLIEVDDFRDKLNKIFPGDRGSKWLDTFHGISREFQKYILVRTVVGLMTGTLVWLFSMVIGLEFAFVWGFTNFILNYIPTLGSIIGVIPPVLFALVQYDGVGMVFVVLFVVGGIQIVMGTYIDPLMQGKYLALSSLVVLISVVFWGWVWGIIGAFLSIPITVFMVLTAKKFSRTKWLSTLLIDQVDKKT